MEKDVINILIVDDEKYEGILMEKSVAWESEGFHIMGNVQCAEDALALMEKQTPDIVYTDINMPRIDGLELSRRIRETYPAVHIVIVTGYREFEYAREAIHIGVEEFLLKPIQSDELLAASVKLREQILKEREQQSKDVEIYPVLAAMMEKIVGSCPYKSPTDMGVNMAGNCIFDDEAVKEAANQEIIRRFYTAKCNQIKGRANKDEIYKLELLMNNAGLSVDDRKCAVEALKLEEETNAPCAAIELNDGTIVTGKTSALLGCSSAMLLNALKTLAKIDDADLLIAPCLLYTSDAADD